MLEEVKKKAQEIANNSHKQIIMGVYQKMVNSHNAFCGCNYCIILREYVQTKKYLSAMNRRMNHPEYDYYNSSSVLYDLCGLQSIRNKVKELKLQKDGLKKNYTEPGV